MVAREGIEPSYEAYETPELDHYSIPLHLYNTIKLVDVIGLEPTTLRFSLSTFSCCLDYVFTIGFYTLRYWALMKDYCLGCSPSSLCTFRVTNCHLLGLAQSCRRNFPFSSRMINPELTACR